MTATPTQPTLAETRIVIDGTTAENARVLNHLTNRIFAAERHSLHAPLSTAGYELTGTVLVGYRNGRALHETSVRLFGSIAEVQTMVNLIARYATYRG